MSDVARTAEHVAPRVKEWRGDAVAAVLLSVTLTAAWAWVNRIALDAWWLPDTDDAVRLRQILDWIAGQRFDDLTQARMGFAGVPMHWSRLPDLVPAALIVSLRGVIGEHLAVIVAVVAWPTALFAGALFACARIGRAIGARGLDAMLIAALAYPATTLFQPGRIDHHGLQLVLLLLTVWGVLRGGGWRSGVAVGVASAMSVAVGMEMVPLLVVTGGMIAWRWATGGERDVSLAYGYVAGLIAAMVLAGAALRSDSWAYPACDGFGVNVYSAALAAVGAFAASLIAGIQIRAVRARLAMVMAAGLVAAGIVLLRIPACVHPYGAVDPMVVQQWLRRVAEARPLLGSDPHWAISYAGLMLVGIAAGGWLAWRGRDTVVGQRVGVILSVQVAALAVTMGQMRGAYAGAVLAAPILAVVIGAARRRGAAVVAAGWLAAAGISYPLLARTLPGTEASGPEADDAVCETPATIAALARLPAGVVWAPIDMGARIVAMTAHRVLAAPYHRDNAGNRFFLDVVNARADVAEKRLREAGVDYVVACGAAFAPFARPDHPEDIAALLAAGRRPAWLVPVSGTPGVFRLAAHEASFQAKRH